jgi:plastocyanin
MMTRRGLRRIFACILLFALASCGDKASPSPPVETNTITITSAGVSPKNIIVTVGQRVRFVNNDSNPHNMASDPHPSHDDCPEFDQVGFLAPGQSRETGNLVTVRTCGFHDHDLPGVTNLQGTVTIR